MSFLNPVNEPVLRFKSTDAGAPQINYNARTAGDVKAVLKACLVTGYGDKESAGWSIVNEVNHVAEFVSPSVAMSDYRLGIDDTSASDTTWYYQYQNLRTNPLYNAPTKNISNAEKTNPSNGWQFFVTNLGFLLVELIQHSAVKKLSARITYLGQTKSSLPDSMGSNMMFFNIGHLGAIRNNYTFYTADNYIHAKIGAFTTINTSSATSNALSAAAAYTLDSSVLDLISPIYLVDGTLILGEIPPILSKIVNSSSDTYGVSDEILSGRTVTNITAGVSNPTAATAQSHSRSFAIKTDYWEY